MNRTPEEIISMKGIFPCHQCQKFGHRENDNNENGTLRHGVNSSDSPLSNGSNENKNVKIQFLIGFNTSFCSSEDTIRCNTAVAQSSEHRTSCIR